LGKKFAVSMPGVGECHSFLRAGASGGPVKKAEDLSTNIRLGKYRYLDIAGNMKRHSMLNDCLVGRAGKKAAGRILDGRDWNEVPG